MGNATLSIAESFPVEDNFESLKFVNDNEKNDEEIKNVSKGIAAFWLWPDPSIGQDGVIKLRFSESFAKILHCVCIHIALRRTLFWPIPILTSERPFMDTRTKNTTKNWVCMYVLCMYVHYCCMYVLLLYLCHAKLYNTTDWSKNLKLFKKSMYRVATKEWSLHHNITKWSKYCHTETNRAPNSFSDQNLIYPGQ